ncbi:MAG: hypothetical protein EBR82_40375 [Caulobacteraceae bacterium]|nr:hypothetical protein [Caulobacteraceae bacterium]
MAKTNFRKEFPKLVKNVNGEQFEMDAEEYEATIALWEANEIEALAKQAEAQANATARAALLSKLGITAEEAQLLLS